MSPNLTPVIRRSALLRTTALLTMLPILAAIQPAHAEFILDSDGTGGTGNLNSDSMSLSDTSLVWFDTITGNYVDGDYVTAESASSSDTTLVLSNPTAPDVTLDLSGFFRFGVLRLEDSDYTINGSVLQGAGMGLRFSADGSSRTLNLSSALRGNVMVSEDVTLRYSGNSSNIASLSVERDGALVLSGSLAGDVGNQGEVELTATSNIDGSLDNGRLRGQDDDIETSAVVTVTGDGATIGGDVHNDGVIQSVTDGAKLVITGRLTNEESGQFIAERGNDDLVIEADEFLLIASEGGYTVAGNGNVRLVGTEIVARTLVYDRPQGLDEGWVDGGIKTEGSGSVSVKTQLNGNAYDIENQTRFSITDNGGVTNVDVFTNSSTDTGLQMASGTTLDVNTLINSGVVNSEGEITAASTDANAIQNLAGGDFVAHTVNANVTNDLDASFTANQALTGDVINDGTMVLNGSVTGNISNSDTGDLQVDAAVIGDLENDGIAGIAGSLTGNVTNNTGGVLTSSSAIDGDLSTSGNATVSGSVTGTLANTAVAADGLSLDLVGTLDVNELTNTAASATNVATGAAVEVTQQVENLGALNVAGSMDATVNNIGTLDVTDTGEVGGIVTNTATGTLTSTGTLGGLVNNSANTDIAGTVTGDVQNNSGATLLSSAAIVGDLTNDGIASVSGSVDGTLTNNATDTATQRGFTLTDDLSVGALVNTGDLDIDEGRMLSADDPSSNSGTMNVAGTLDASVENSATLDVTDTGEVSGTVTNSATGTLTSTGTLGGLVNDSANTDIAGTVTGDVQNNSGATLLSSAAVGGDLTNDGIASVSGSVDGTLTNNATDTATQRAMTFNSDMTVGNLVNTGDMSIDAGRTLSADTTSDNSGTMNLAGTLDGALDNSGTLDVADTGEVSGTVTNSATGTLTSTGTIGGLVNDSANANIAGTVTGDVENQDDGVLVSTAEIGGDLTNSGNATLSAGSVGGDVANESGGTLVSSVDIGGGVTNGGTATLSGEVAGNVENSGGATMNVAGDLVTGTNIAAPGETLLNLGTLNLTGSLTGRLRNRDVMNISGGRIIGSLRSERLINWSGNSTVDGDLANLGWMTGNGAGTTLTVSNGLFFNDGMIDVASGSTLTITADLIEFGEFSEVATTNVTLIGDVLNSGNLLIDEAEVLVGGIVNGATGTVVVTADVDAANNDITNYAQAPDDIFRVGNGGNLHDIGTLTNHGTMEIASGGAITATNNPSVNASDGHLILGGTLTTTLDNQQGALLEMDGGNLIGNVDNAGAISGNGTISGNLANSGIADMGGNIGQVTNTGTVGTNGDLTVTSLTNDGSVTIDDGDTLRAGSTVINRDQMVIAGTLDAGLGNWATGTVDMQDGTITGDVNNGGRITGTGEIGGAVTNRGRMEMGGSVTGALNNTGWLGTNGDLTLSRLTTTGTVDIAAGDTLNSGEPVVNDGRLVVAGTLNTALTNSAGSTTVMNGGELRGVVNDGRLQGTGTITGHLNNTGTAVIAGTANTINNSGVLNTGGDLSAMRLVTTGNTNIIDGTTLTLAEQLANRGRLSVAGTLAGNLENVAGATTVMSDGAITGNFTNAGALRGGGDIGGDLSNTGTVNIRVGETLNVASTDNYSALNVAGRLNSDVINRASASTNLTNGRIDGAIDNRGILRGSGQINGALTNRNTVTVNGDLTVQDLVNSGTVSLSAGDRLAATGTASNLAGGQINMGTGRFVGNLDSAGTIAGSGVITGVLTTTGGTLDLNGDLTVGKLDNQGALTIAAGDRVISGSVAENTGNLNIAGTLAGSILNGEGADNGTLRLSGGEITGAVENRAGSTLIGNGTIGGRLTNAGLAQLAGTLADVQNNNELNTNGALSVASLANRGIVNIAAGHSLTSASAVGNSGEISIAGALNGDLANGDNATTTLRGGSISGNVSNTGVLSGNGSIGGTLTTIDGNTDISGSIGGDLVNLAGTIGTTGNLVIEGQILNSAQETLVLGQRGMRLSAASDPGVITINQGHTVTTKEGARNGPDAALNVDGRLIGNVTNNGVFELTGVLDGSLLTGNPQSAATSTASATLGGRVTGDVVYAAGSLDMAHGLRIGGLLDLQKDYTIQSGRNIAAATTQVREKLTFAQNAALGGDVNNLGRLAVAGTTAAIAGNLTNSGTVDLTGGNRANTVLNVGGLSGNGEILMDVRTVENLASDRIVVRGGATTGTLNLSLNSDSNQPTGSSVGRRVTLIDVDDSFGSANDYSFSASGLTSSSEKIVYSLDQLGDYGDLTLVSQVNPAIGAMFANVTLVQSLIGSVINRPTSPYVTGLVTDYAEKPCGVGGWGRVTGGNATVKGRTDNGVSNPENRVTSSYYGMQGGMDMVCFDDRFGGWDMAFGALGGVNIGDSRQPIYAIDGLNATVTTGALASITTTDFQQTYGGVYLTGTKGRWTADLQFRAEKTDFELKNTPVSGSGLGISDPDFSSDGLTLSGSVAYSMPVKDTGWIFTPNVGFSLSKYSTDNVEFSDGFMLEFDDSERKVGFVGASVGKTFVREAENAALHTFATATHFKDFADNPISRLYNDSLEGYETQVMTSEHLRNYTELSVGANYVKVLDPARGPRARQFSTSARIDAGFGEAIDSVSVTGQFRLQF